MPSLRATSRIALFAALVYVLSCATVFLPNISLMYFVVFAAGFLWGFFSGVAVGLIGMWLFSTFNPYGPATVPVTIAQMSGAALCGAVGAGCGGTAWQTWSRPVRAAVMAGMGVLCSVLYYLPVGAADAIVFGPFWPRFIGGIGFGLFAIVSNAVIFPLLFAPLTHLYIREHGGS